MFVDIQRLGRKPAQRCRLFVHSAFDLSHPLLCGRGLPQSSLKRLELLILITRPDFFEVTQTTPNLFQLAPNPVGLLRLGEQLAQLVPLTFESKLQSLVLLIPLGSPNFRHVIEDGEKALRLGSQLVDLLLAEDADRCAVEHSPSLNIPLRSVPELDLRLRRVRPQPRHPQ